MSFQTSCISQLEIVYGCSCAKIPAVLHLVRVHHDAEPHMLLTFFQQLVPLGWVPWLDKQSPQVPKRKVCFEAIPQATVAHLPPELATPFLRVLSCSGCIPLSSQACSHSTVQASRSQVRTCRCGRHLSDRSPLGSSPCPSRGRIHEMYHVKRGGTLRSRACHFSANVVLELPLLGLRFDLSFGSWALLRFSSQSTSRCPAPSTMVASPRASSPLGRRTPLLLWSPSLRLVLLELSGSSVIAKRTQSASKPASSASIFSSIRCRQASLWSLAFDPRCCATRATFGVPICS